ncbi:hypothetical protein FACS1894122_13960 [Alphaproteobacteria bacterium]|nr:hypothetical protein FACS1894122_13960 [Alphaproteobacteria bacterium]
MINVALYHPQIPQNTGTLLRLASCLGFAIDLIRPFGFIFDDKRLLHNELFFARARKNADTCVVAQDRSVLGVHEDSLEMDIACAASTEANCEKEPLCSGLDKKLKRAGMDYISTANYRIHDSFDEFLKKYHNRRVIALESNNITTMHHDFSYKSDDILLVGSEHYGFLKEDLVRLKHMVKIPMLPQRRSINMAIAATVVISEAMSQLKLYP